MRNSKVINGNKIAIVKPQLFESEKDSLILKFDLQVPRNIFEINMIIEKDSSIDIVNQDSFADAYDYLDQFMTQREIDRVMDFIDSTANKLIKKLGEK